MSENTTLGVICITSTFFYVMKTQKMILGPDICSLDSTTSSCSSLLDSPSHCACSWCFHSHPCTASDLCPTSREDTITPMWRRLYTSLQQQGWKRSVTRYSKTSVRLLSVCTMSCNVTMLACFRSFSNDTTETDVYKKKNTFLRHGTNCRLNRSEVASRYEAHKTPQMGWYTSRGSFIP